MSRTRKNVAEATTQIMTRPVTSLAASSRASRTPLPPAAFPSRRLPGAHVPVRHPHPGVLADDRVAGRPVRIPLVVHELHVDVVPELDDRHLVVARLDD